MGNKVWAASHHQGEVPGKCKPGGVSNPAGKLPGLPAAWPRPDGATLCFSCDPSLPGLSCPCDRLPRAWLGLLRVSVTCKCSVEKSKEVTEKRDRKAASSHVQRA